VGIFLYQSPTTKVEGFLGKFFMKCCNGKIKKIIIDFSFAYSFKSSFSMWPFIKNIKNFSVFVHKDAEEDFLKEDKNTVIRKTYI